MASSSSSSSYNSPCAACKFLRRKCLPGCTFAPYFPPEDPQKFINVHKIFGASNVTKLLNELLPYQREDAVNTLAYEADARIRDPVYGCVGAITFLQRQVQRLQKELDAANSDLIRYAAKASPTIVMPNVQQGLMGSEGYPNPQATRALRPVDLGRRVGNEGAGGGGFYQNSNPSFSLPYNNLPWDGNNFSGGINGNVGDQGNM